MGGNASLLGPELLIVLLNISNSSLHRYERGGRPTPDAVADRLHFLALVVADLLGAYNSRGVRRWFVRPRSALDGLSPAEFLGEDWKSYDEQSTKVAQLAAALLSMPIT